MKHNLSKISVLFVTFSFFVWWFWYGFSRLWYRHFKNKANAKESLHKNLEHCHHIGANPSVIDAIENGWNISFFTCYSYFNNFVLSNNQPALQNEDFVTHTVKKLLKSSRIKKIRTPFCFVKSFYYRQKQS